MENYLYHLEKNEHELIPEKIENINKSYFEGDFLFVYQSINYRDQIYGTIYIKVYGFSSIVFCNYVKVALL